MENEEGRFISDDLIQLAREKGKHQAAEYIKDYSKMKKLVSVFERRRPSIVKRLGISTEGGFEAPAEEELRYLSKKDRRITEKYLRDKAAIAKVDTVISCRLHKTDAAIIRSIIDDQISTKEAAEKNGVSYVTARRARVRFREAFADEVQPEYLRKLTLVDANGKA